MHHLSSRFESRAMFCDPKFFCHSAVVYPVFAITWHLTMARPDTVHFGYKHNQVVDSMNLRAQRQRRENLIFNNNPIQ